MADFAQKPCSHKQHCLLPLILLLAGAGTACVGQPPAEAGSPSSNPAVVKALTTGVWHSYVPDDESIHQASYQEGGDFVYELTFADGTYGGRAYWVRDGRHKSEIPITGVTLDGDAIEIRLGGFPPYQGQADLAAGRIAGGLVGEPFYREMNLTRVEAAAWPMIRPRPAPMPEEPADLWIRPAQRDDGWATAAVPSDVGITKAAVEATVRAILAGEAGALHAFLVARDGKLVVEEYFHGWGADDLHQFASCTKSVASLLVGIAVDQGLVSGVGAPLLGFFPEYLDSVGQGWEALRLEHLLTMTMGLDWEGNERYWLPPPGVDRFADILGRHVVVPPGKRWNYSDRNMSLLPGIFRQATGVTADAFAAKHLFAPLGITAWDWDKKRWHGHPDMVGSLELRPRDMAKLGQLVLDEGAWQGRRVISAEWIRESTRGHVPVPSEEGVTYGYLWRRMDSRLGPVTFAVGTGSHFILVAPDARMVIVTTAGNQFNGRHSAILKVVDRYLVPGVSPAR